MNVRSSPLGLAIELGAAVESTVKDLLEICLEDLERDDVVPAIGNLNAGLRRVRSCIDSERWKDIVTSQIRSHPILARLHESPLSQRSFYRPRGYPGDAEIIDFVYGYGGARAGTRLGNEIFDYEFNVQGCASVRLRRAIVQTRLDRLFARNPNAQVFSVAAGHLREIEAFQLVQLGKSAKIVALDQDAQSLEHIAQRLDSQHIQLVKASLKELFLNGIVGGDFDFIYSMGCSTISIDALRRR